MEHANRFAELVLDETSLHTPNGIMPLAEITLAEIVREVVKDAPGESSQQTSATAVVGGAAVGGVLLGPVGAVAGGLMGSTVKEEVAAEPRFHTASVKLVFETRALSYEMDLARDQEAAAGDFVKAVKKAVKHHR